MGYEHDMDDWHEEMRHRKNEEMLHERTKFELWADQYNHTLEFTRTVVQVLVFILQLIIIWRLF